VTPDTASGNLSDKAMTNTMKRCNLRTGDTGGETKTNVSNVLFVKLRHAVTRAASAGFRSGLPTCAALANHVLHVVGLRSKKQVRRFDAKGNVAGVHNLKPVGDCSPTKHVSETIGENLLSVSVDLSAIDVVAGLNNRPRPNQALTFAVCALPKVLSKLLIGDDVHKQPFYHGPVTVEVV
jgi:hypothetical protein